MSEKAFIYSLSDPRTGAIRYVGKTFNLSKRLYAHKNDKSKTHKVCWIKSLQALGLEPTMAVLETLVDVSDDVWQQAEIAWINKLRLQGCDLTNLASGGHGGSHHCLETKQKISLAKTGRKLPPFTREHRARMAIANTGKKHSEVTKKKLSLAGIGRTRTISNEHRARISRSRMGKKHSPETLLKIGLASSQRTQSEEARAKISQAIKEHWVKRKSKNE